ncbi:MAG: restriction endonuclease subunit S [Nitrospirales bacterium]
MTTTQTVLKDICIRITKGTTPTTMGRPFVEEGINFVKAEALNGDTSLEQGGFAFIDEDTHQMLRRSILEQDDVLVTIAGANTGRCGFVKEGDLPANTNQAVGIVRVDKEKAEPRFIYYFFKQKQTAQYIQTLSAQAAQPNLNLANLGNIRVELPSRAEQDRIASILSAYDDLIENNRRRIQLLEQAARLLYKEWFVHFRFPGHEHTKIHNGNPEGWEKKILGDLCQEIRESVSPSALESNTPYIGLEHMPRRSISLSEWGTSDQVTSSKHRFRENEILFGKIRPYFHKVGIAFTDGVVSSDAIVIRPLNNALMSLVLMTVSSDGFVAVTAQTMKEGSKMPRADWKQMQQYIMLLPPDSLLMMFNSVIEPIIRQLKTLSLNNRKLGTARDLLLPRLMNGEVAV